MQLWEQIILGLIAGVILLLGWPGVKRAIEQGQASKDPDWKGLLPLLVAVILFVLLLIFLVKIG